MDGSGNMPTKFDSENLRERRHYKNQSMYLHPHVQDGLGSLKIYI